MQCCGCIPKKKKNSLATPLNDSTEDSNKTIDIPKSPTPKYVPPVIDEPKVLKASNLPRESKEPSNYEKEVGGKVNADAKTNVSNMEINQVRSTSNESLIFPHELERHHSVAEDVVISGWLNFKTFVAEDSVFFRSYFMVRSGVLYIFKHARSDPTSDEEGLQLKMSLTKNVAITETYFHEFPFCININNEIIINAFNSTTQQEWLLTLLREKDILTLETVMSMSDVSTGNSLNAITDTDTPPPDTFSRTTNVHEWTTKLIESKQIALKFLQQDILVTKHYTVGFGIHRSHAKWLKVNVDGDKLIWTEATKADLKSRKSHNEVLQKSLKRNSLMVTSTTASTAGGDRGQVGSFHSNPRKSVSGLSSLNAGHAGMGSADNSRIEVSRESSSSSLFSMDSSAADSAEEKFILLTNIVEVREDGESASLSKLRSSDPIKVSKCVTVVAAIRLDKSKGTSTFKHKEYDFEFASVDVKAEWITSMRLVLKVVDLIGGPTVK